MHSSASRLVPRLGLLLGALSITMAVVVFGGAAPVSATPCVGIGATFVHDAGVGKAVFTAEKHCDTGKVRVYGTLYDTKCDHRAVRLTIAYGDGIFGNDIVEHGGGCNTSRTFDENAYDPGVFVRLYMLAYNWGGESSLDYGDYYF